MKRELSQEIKTDLEESAVAREEHPEDGGEQ
jgi:hypothetical protein